MADNLFTVGSPAMEDISSLCLGGDYVPAIIYINILSDFAESGDSEFSIDPIIYTNRLGIRLICLSKYLSKLQAKGLISHDESLASQWRRRNKGWLRGDRRHVIVVNKYDISGDISGDICSTKGQSKSNQSQTKVKSKSSQCTAKPLELFDSSEEIEKKPNKKNEYSEEFTRVYKEYPRKTGKFAAFRSWRQLNKKEKSLLEESVRKNASNMGKNGLEYVKHLSTYINQRCWEDERQISREEIALNKLLASAEEFRK